MSSLEPYRQIGPFDADSLPRGLLAEHRLKPGSWGRVTMLSGTIGFAWDDDAAGDPITLSAGDVMLVPPQRPHHLELCGPFVLQIEFLRETAVPGRGQAQGLQPVVQTRSPPDRPETAPS